MKGRLTGFWHPERSNPNAPKGEKKGRVRLSVTLTTKLETRSKSNSTVKVKTCSVDEFGVWLAKNYSVEAQDLIGAIRKGLSARGYSDGTGSDSKPT